MKTAMQELIDEIKLIESYPMNPLLIKIATDLLDKEKEQIADAFRSGSTSSMLGGGHWTQYYNQTYNK